MCRWMRIYFSFRPCNNLNHYPRPHLKAEEIVPTVPLSWPRHMCLALDALPWLPQGPINIPLHFCRHSRRLKGCHGAVETAAIHQLEKAPAAAVEGDQQEVDQLLFTDIYLICVIPDIQRIVLARNMCRCFMDERYCCWCTICRILKKNGHHYDNKMHHRWYCHPKCNNIRYLYST